MKNAYFNKIAVLALFLMFPMFGWGQNAGDLDASFNYGRGADYQFNAGYGANETIKTTVLQPDGKIVIGGEFTSYNGYPINGLARLNSNTTIDTSFIHRLDTLGGYSIKAIAIQPNGKILIGGSFYSNGILQFTIVRLNSDASLDTSFNRFASEIIGSIYSISIQPDGKIIAGGYFGIRNSANTNRNLLRLNGNGTIDTSFHTGTGTDNNVLTTAIQEDGKILIGGSFTSYNNASKNYLARLNPNGSLDTNFTSGIGPNNYVNSIAILNNGKILIGGNFTSFSGAETHFLARLTEQGNFDFSFNQGTGLNGYIYAIALTANQKIMIGGGFTIYNNYSCNKVARLNIDGSFDSTFNSTIGANTYVNSIVSLPDGKSVISGYFTKYNNKDRKRIAFLNPDGSLDLIANQAYGASGYVSSITIQPDRKIIIGGNFTNYNSTNQNYLARIKSDGGLDSSFNIGTGPNNPVFNSKIQQDGKILICGTFTTYNGINKNGIARLNPDGSLDRAFNPIANDAISFILLQPDNKILVSGSFININGFSRNSIARLNSDGSIDTTFNPGLGPNNSISTIALPSDGKILIGGSFTSYNGTSINGVARLNSNGTIDNSFISGVSENGTVSCIYIKENHNIMISGKFVRYQGIVKNSMALLDSNGTLMQNFSAQFTVFYSPFYIDNFVRFVPLPNDKYLVTGRYRTPNINKPNYFLVLNSNGSLDRNLKTLGINGDISPAAIQPDGKILFGGSFTGFNNLSTPGIVRIHGVSIPNQAKSPKNIPDFELYPNPTTGIVSLTTTPTSQKVTLINSLGQVVFTSSAQEKMELNLSHLSKGVYLVQVQSANGIRTERLVVK